MTTREILEKVPREDGIAFFNAKKTDKEIYDLLVSKGLTDDFDTFKAEAEKNFKEKVSKMSKDEIMAQMEGAELTESQLEMIAGGDKDEDTGVIVGSSLGGGMIAGALAFVAYWMI